MTSTDSSSRSSTETANRMSVRTDSGHSDQIADHPLLADGVAKELVRWFKLLADETRLRILFLLLESGELNVRSLCELLALSQPAVSHHLALLRVDGLIECRRDGKHNYYRILPHRFGELIGKVVEAVPGEDPEISIGRVSLSVLPSEGDGRPDGARAGV